MNGDLLHPGFGVSAIAGVFGLIFGSFLNVCIVRWGAEPKQSVVRPRSRCPRCGSELRPYDNIPVVSWLVLGGNCRNCREPISPLYPLVELTTAIVWGYMAWRHGVTLEALTGAVFFTVLLGIAITDFRAYIIPDEFTLGGLVLGLMLAAFAGWSPLLWAAIGAAAGFALLWAVGFLGTIAFRKDAMGGGDIKMMAMVGAFVGWKGVLVTIFLGAVLGTLVFVPIHFIDRNRLVPFGIFLALGAAAAWIAGPALIGWYTGYAGL